MVPGGAAISDDSLAVIGERLRASRERAGLTLDELAARTGLSKPHLSRLESAERQPSITALLAISAAVGAPVSTLLGEDDSAPALAVHLDDVTRHEAAGLRIAPCSGFTGSSALEALRVTIDPGRVPGPPARHRGEEWLYVVDGTLRLEYDGRVHEVGAGGCVHFDAERPHRLEAVGGFTEVLLVAADGWRTIRNAHQ